MAHIHFVGIGGIGMSGIAMVLLEMGYKVSGSDLKASRITKRLEMLGATCYADHNSENVIGADVIVVSSAIPEDNPEIIEARKRNIKIIQRAEMLGSLMKEKTGIAVAGTHGKTTTTSMVAKVLEYNGLNPTVVIGGELNDSGSNAKLGYDPYFIAEADESDASFLNLSPKIAIITSIDSDVNLNVMPYSACNFDYEMTMKKIKENFLIFINRIPDDGKIILCSDNSHIRELIPEISKPIITYGINSGADLEASNISLARFCSTSTVKYKGKILGELTLRVPGKHNVLNALASIAVGLQIGMDFDSIKEALFDFQGVKRRFQIYGEIGDVLIVDDYAHNPSKIKAALHAAQTGWKNRVVAVFQPHRYSRTMFLFNEFTEAFSDADVLIVTDIYSAGEEPILGIKGENIAETIHSKVKKKEVFYIPKAEDVIAFLHKNSRPGDLIITLGAGDICKVAEKLYYQLKKTELDFAATG